MTDPKNTEDQELSLDQLKDAAGAYCGMNLGEVSVPAARITKRPTKPQDNFIVSADPGCDDI